MLSTAKLLTLALLLATFIPPTMSAFTTREQIIEVVNRLFLYTDAFNWEGLQSEVFTEVVFFDMSSLGQEASNMTSQAICAQWEQGLAGIDSVFHLVGSHAVTVNPDNSSEATVTCYSKATHYNASATMGHTRDFVGSYDLGMVETDNGWRMNSFVFNVEFMLGNLGLN